MIGSDADIANGQLSSAGDLGTQACPPLGFTISTLWLLRLPPGVILPRQPEGEGPCRFTWGAFGGLAWTRHLLLLPMFRQESATGPQGLTEREVWKLITAV